MVKISNLWKIGNCPNLIMNDLELWKNLYEEIKGVDKNVVISNEAFIHYLNIETLNYIKNFFIILIYKLYLLVEN